MKSAKETMRTRSPLKTHVFLLVTSHFSSQNLPGLPRLKCYFTSTVSFPGKNQKMSWFSRLPSGKQPHSYGKSPFYPFLMGKLTINGHVQ